MPSPCVTPHFLISLISLFGPIAQLLSCGPTKLHQVLEVLSLLIYCHCFQNRSLLYRNNILLCTTGPIVLVLMARILFCAPPLRTNLHSIVSSFTTDYCTRFQAEIFGLLLSKPQIHILARIGAGLSKYWAVPQVCQRTWEI